MKTHHRRHAEMCRRRSIRLSAALPPRELLALRDDSTASRLKSPRETATFEEIHIHAEGAFTMQIQVHTDNHTEGSAKLIEHVTQVVSEKLHRFARRMTRVEVHLSDENSGAKPGDDDKRCVIEARLSGLQPITVSDRGASSEQALLGAVGKMLTTLDRTLGRLADR